MLTETVRRLKAARYSSLTVSGKVIDFENPDPDQIDITDIARSTSRICRFGGHIGPDYSVAQHMIMCASVAPTPLKKQLLLHDASEAYVGDMISPLKAMMPAFHEVENRLHRAIGLKFGVELVDLPQEAKDIDLQMGMTEAIQFRRPPFNGRDLMFQVPDRIQPYDITLAPMTAENAELMYLHTFDRLFYPLKAPAYAYVA